MKAPALPVAPLPTCKPPRGSLCISSGPKLQLLNPFQLNRDSPANTRKLRVLCCASGSLAEQERSIRSQGWLLRCHLCHQPAKWPWTAPFTSFASYCEKWGGWTRWSVSSRFLPALKPHVGCDYWGLQRRSPVMSKSIEKNSSDHRVVWLPKPELPLIWEYRGNISNPDEGKIWALVLQGYVKVQLPLKVENAQSQLTQVRFLAAVTAFIYSASSGSL